MQITRCHKKGFTLIEFVLTVAIIGIASMLLGPIIGNGIKSYGLVVKRRAALAETRLVVNRVFDEILMIESTGDIGTWAASSISFDTQEESGISYSLSGTNLMRSGILMASNVNSLGFTYLDANGQPAVLKNNIQTIGIELEISAGIGFGIIKVKTAAFPRGFDSAYGGFED